MGVVELSESAKYGAGVDIAIIDSGCPKPLCIPSGTSYGPSNDLDDEFGHSTSISSIFFGGNGITGLCACARPFYFKALDNDGNGTVESVVECINGAVDHNVDLINLSLGFFRTERCPKSLVEACERAYSLGKPIFCAAGNDGGAVNWPAALKSTICVGSAGKNGLKMPFSSVGEVDFVAPGQSLRVLDKKGCHTLVSGTSFSTALVAGVAALIIAGMKGSRPNFSVDAVKEALRSIAHDVEDPGWDRKTGYGLISGHQYDSTVCMKIKRGFFGTIFDKIHSLLGFTEKGEYYGRV